MGTALNGSTDNHRWWQEGIIYQIYPRSFQDTNGDGIGDIQGIISRLYYLKWLGVTILWISPVFPSPMKDFGYDISDYTGIDPIFGSIQDFDHLLTEVHRLGMRLLIDLVPNHSSDQHPWFLASSAGKDQGQRDWYIWADASTGGRAPNNWLSVFGGSAWEWHEPSGQYYYHAFLKEQPDLNYRNPQVRTAMWDVMRFWLKKGVDGFRVDVLWHMIKDKQLRDNPVNPLYREEMGTYEKLIPIYSTDQPEIHELVSEMRKVTDEFGDRLLIGEIYLPADKLVAYYGDSNQGVHLPFNFQLLLSDWDARIISSAIRNYLNLLPQGAWPNWVLGNHDQPRIASRVGSAQAWVAAMLLLTLPGTPTMYYGDELGLANVPIPLENIKDPQGLNMPGKNLSRDPARTPMQWDSTRNAGFSSGIPWLPVGKSYEQQNVATELNEPNSILLFYKKLIALRQSEPSLRTGAYEQVFSDGQVLFFTRHAAGEDSFLILLNFTHQPCRCMLDDKYTGTIVLATHSSPEHRLFTGSLFLDGDEAIIIRIKNMTK